MNSSETNKEPSKTKSSNTKKNSKSYKIEVGGLPEGTTIADLNALINTELQLNPVLINIVGFGTNLAYVHFSDDSSRTKAAKTLNGYVWKTATLIAIASTAEEPNLQCDIDYLMVRKKAFSLTVDLLAERAVIPLKTQPFTIRYTEKEKSTKEIFCQLADFIQTNNESLTKLFEWQKSKRNGEILEMDALIPSASMKGYFNVGEFDIGLNEGSPKPVVGFRICRGVQKPLVMGPASNLSHFDEKIKTSVKMMESHLASSTHPPFDPIFRRGVWRKFYVRTSNNYDLMLVAQIHVKGLSNEQINKLKMEFKNFFCHGPGKKVFATSLFIEKWQYNKKGEPVSEFENIHGKTFTKEKFFTSTFQTSAGVYLQANRSVYESLCNRVAEYADVCAATQILDICCGSGSLGLFLAKKGFQINGVDSNASAVEDAKQNAQSNDITNAVFIHGKPEELVEGMIRMSKNKKCLAIVHSSNGTLNCSVLENLKKSKSIEHIIYISDDPQSDFSNFSILGQHKGKDLTDFFMPVRTGVVDLSPENVKFTLVTLFERYNASKWDCIMTGKPKPKDKAYYERLTTLANKVQQEQQKKAAPSKAKKIKSKNSNNQNQNQRQVQDQTQSQGQSQNQGQAHGMWVRSRKSVAAVNMEIMSEEEIKEYERGYQAAIKWLAKQKSMPGGSYPSMSMETDSNDSFGYYTSSFANANQYQGSTSAFTQGQMKRSHSYVSQKSENSLEQSNNFAAPQNRGRSVQQGNWRSSNQGYYTRDSSQNSQNSTSRAQEDWRQPSNSASTSDQSNKPNATNRGYGQSSKGNSTNTSRTAQGQTYSQPSSSANAFPPPQPMSQSVSPVLQFPQTSFQQSWPQPMTQLDPQQYGYTTYSFSEVDFNPAVAFYGYSNHAQGPGGYWK